MIGVIFQFGSEIVEVRVDNTNVLFRTQATAGGFAPMEALSLDKNGVLKEHPDLKDNPDWRAESIKRFKAKIESFSNEDTRMDYIIEDLGKFGYKPMYKQKAGFRPVKL